MGYAVGNEVEQDIMNTWYVKDLSKLTSVSVRTLHYYDKIGLLKPSDRLPNGYRVYTEKDVKKLEQIISLKFFGFTLARIKQLLSHQELTLEQLEQQLISLQSEVSFLQEAQRNLLAGSIIEYKKTSAIDWHKLVTMINKSTEVGKEIAQHAHTSVNQQKSAPKDPSQTQTSWHAMLSKIQDFENDTTPK